MYITESDQILLTNTVNKILEQKIKPDFDANIPVDLWQRDHDIQYNSLSAQIFHLYVNVDSEYKMMCVKNLVNTIVYLLWQQFQPMKPLMADNPNLWIEFVKNNLYTIKSF